MAKPVNSTIEIGLSEGTNASKVSINKKSGEITLTDDEGREVAPEYVCRTLHYDRPDRPDKGPKIQVRHKLSGALDSLGGLKGLAQYDSIFVIDTNTLTLEENPVSVACFIRCQILSEGENFYLVSKEGQLNIYEFHNVEDNPELLSILRVANDVLRSEGRQAERNIAIVTDTELGSHDDINSRLTPIYGSRCLPAGFTLLYASSDTGKEVLNHLIRFCDRQSNKYLTKLQQGAANAPGLHTLSEDSSVKYRFTYHPDLNIPKQVVGEISVDDDTIVGEPKFSF